MFNRNNEQKRRVINKEIQTEQKKKKKSSGNGFYYSFLTIVLLLCLFQISVSAVLNISKIVSYKAKIIQMKKTHQAAMNLNNQLKDSINNYSDIAGMEAIARNNLKMSGEDEVLVIINTPTKEENPDKNNIFSIFKNNQ